ncbi:MAG: MFS transporter [Betaproteobacteria bacterium]|nr:MFS transporter [Betaproteobacteria bacterium]
MSPDRNASATALAEGSMTRDGVRNSALVVFCQVVHWLTITAIPLLLPLIREDLQISFTQAGMLSVAATLSYALMQIPAGYLSDRFGPARLFFIGLLGWSALSLAFGLIHAFWLALLTQFVAGFFRALLFAPGLALLASWFPPGRRATAMSLFMLGGFTGSIVLALVGPLLAALYGWRAAFIFFSALGIGAALIYKAYAKENPRAPQQLALLDVFRLARYPVLWVCSGLQFVRFTVVTAFNFWLPSLLVADRGLSVQEAGLVMAMSAALMAPSSTLGGYVSDRLGNPPLVIGAALAILACTSTLLVAVESVPLLLLVIAVNSIFLQFYFGPLFLVPMEVLGPRTAGTATGFTNLFANIGGLLTAYALGVVKDQTGAFTWGFFGVSGVCLIGVALAVILARVRQRGLAARARP